MRVTRRWKLLLPGAVSLALLGGCPLPPHVPATPPAAALPQTVAPHEGTPYDIVADASLLTIAVYRGGALASAGHNHIIASHDLHGTIYVPPDLMHSSFEVHFDVATLTVDEAELRAQQASADFPADVPESAKQGTRRNMLGEALLDAAHNPEIMLRALRLEKPPVGTAAAADTVLARVQSTVRGEVRTFAVPVHYRLGTGELTVTGEFPLRQSDLGLTPFSAMLGALQVQDEMHISIRLLARAAPVSAVPSPPGGCPPGTPCAAPR
jgi:polyisoprenoid-binding protein YceI